MPERFLRQRLVAMPIVLMLAAGGADDDPRATDTTVAPVVEQTSEPPVGSVATTASSTTGEITSTPDPALCREDGEPWVVGYDTFSDAQEFAAARWEGLTMWQEELGCIDFIKTVDNADGATALANVQTFINRDVDAVLLLQVVSDAQAGIVAELDGAGIPVLATDILAPGAPFLSASDQGVGEQAGQALVDAYEATGVAETPWVVLGTVPAAGPEVGKRMAGARAVIQEALDVPDDQILEVDVNQQTAEEAFNGALSVQGRIPDGVPVLVTAVNDELTNGIFQALEQSGRGRTLLVVGIGGLSVGLQATCQYDEWVGTVDFDPFGQTAYIVSELLLMLNGEDVPDVFHTPAEVLDATGVAERYPEQCDG